MTIKKTTSILSLVLFALLIGSCSKDDPTPEKAMLTIDFAHKINGQNLAFDSVLYNSAKGQKYNVSACRHFITNIYLHKSNGDSILFNEYQYIDAKDKVGTSLSKEVENSSFTMLSVTFGIRKDQNTNGLFVNPPESNMEWPIPMGGGYHYLKFEGKYEDTGKVLQNFQLHTGPLNGVDYSVYFKLPIELNMDSKNKSMELLINMNNWTQSPNILDFANLSKIMGNAAIQSLIQENGKDVIKIGEIK